MAKKFLVSIDLAGNQLLNPVIHNLASDPVSPTPAAGRLYYHTGNNRLMVHQGGSFKQVAFTDELTGTQSLDTLTGWTTTQDLTIGDTLTFNHNAANITLVGAAGSTGTTSIFNTLSTTGNLFGAATTIAIGATSGTLTLNNPTVVGSQTTVNLWNTTSTTVNAFGAATAVGVGATSGTLTLNNPTIVGSASLTLFNTVSTSVTAFSAATTLNLGVGPVSGNTINIGTQATSSGTKAINIGTAGSTGSTTTIVIGTTAGTTPTVTVNGSITLGSYASAGFVKTNGSGVVSVDTNTYALTNQTMNIGTTSVAINRASSALNLTGIPSIDGVAADTATLWSSITTGSIAIGAGLTTGALNLAAAGTGATVVTIGHTNSTTTVNGVFKVGASTLTAGTTATLTLPSTTGTLALTSQIPTVNAGTLGAAASTAGSTNTTVETSFSAAWDANSASNVTIKNVVGPAITNLAAAMTGAGAGIVRKTAQDTYSIDTGTYALQSYVDTAVAGLSWKDEVAVATTAAVGTVSGATLTACPTTLDGFALSSNDRILVKNGSASPGTTAANGIYTVTTLGSGANGVWTRATDADSDTDLRGCSVYVVNGTENGGKRFTSSVVGAITVGTTLLPFVLFSQDATNVVNKYAVTFGDGAATSYTITHNLGTLDVTVEVYTVSGGASVECDVTHTSTTQITLGFVTAPTSNQYRVVVHG